MKSYPVNLLLAKRRCLIVGGGAVALRKASRLLEAEARVRVVAPEAVAGLRELAVAGRIELVLRCCENEDLEGVFLLFLASDDSLLNRQLLERARSCGILCCAVDKNWPDGDFITPASCGGAGLQVAVATGGQSCVRAKSVKNYLAAQLETLNAGVILTTFTVGRETLPETEVGRDIIANVSSLLKLITGVREFCCYRDAGSFEVVALLSADERVNRLLQLTLAAAVPGDKVNERCGEEAFIYLVRKFSGRHTAIFAEADCAAAGFVGSGLKRLKSILMREPIPEPAGSLSDSQRNLSATIKADPEKGWQEYAAYCRKL